MFYQYVVWYGFTALSLFWELLWQMGTQELGIYVSWVQGHVLRLIRIISAWTRVMLLLSCILQFRSTWPTSTWSFQGLDQDGKQPYALGPVRSGSGRSGNAWVQQPGFTRLITVRSPLLTGMDSDGSLTPGISISSGNLNIQVRAHRA